MFFISSAYSDDTSLHGIREALHGWAVHNGIPHWMFEYARTKDQWGESSLSRSISICLTTLTASDVYVGIIHDAYGGTSNAHVANVAFTDLEAFHALRLRKPVLLYVVEPSSRAKETDALLTILQHVAPECFRGVGSQSEVLSWIKRDIMAIHLRKPRAPKMRLGRFLDATTRNRWSQLTSVAGLLLAPPQLAAESDIPAQIADEWINQMSAASILTSDEREIRLSSLLPRIYAVPWRGQAFPNGQRVLDRFCDCWRTATVWHENHHLGSLGCLAAVNTQMFVRCLQAMGDEAQTIDRLGLLELNTGLGSTEWNNVYELGGALGSSYYSLGKQRPGGNARSYLLNQAIRWINVARKIESRVPEPEKFGAGLAAIAGHIQLASNFGDEAEREFTRSLQLRQASGDERGSLAEAKGDLGYLLALNGRRAQGTRMVQEAAVDLSATFKEAFASRIKLKLADLYLRRMRFRDAIREVAEADAICRHHKIALRVPATARARIVLMTLRTLADRHPLRVQVTSSGYTYIR